MVAIDLKSLVGRMNALTRRQLEAAAYGKLRRTLEAEGANFAQFVG